MTEAAASKNRTQKILSSVIHMYVSHFPSQQKEKLTQPCGRHLLTTAYHTYNEGPLFDMRRGWDSQRLASVMQVHLSRT